MEMLQAESVSRVIGTMYLPTEIHIRSLNTCIYCLLQCGREMNASAVVMQLFCVAIQKHYHLLPFSLLRIVH
jgi:hypothetical protein